MSEGAPTGTGTPEPAIPFEQDASVKVSVPGKVLSEHAVQLMMIRSDYLALQSDYTPPSSGPLWGCAGIAGGGIVTLIAGTFDDVFRFAAIMIVTAVAALGTMLFGLQAHRERRAAEQRFKRISSILDPPATVD